MKIEQIETIVLEMPYKKPLDPAIPREVGFNSRAIIDATRPYEWRDKLPNGSGHSAELKDQVRKKWERFLAEKIGRGGS